MLELPERKHIRLESFDYSQNGLYFITLCTYDKANLFGRIGAIHESPSVQHKSADSVYRLVLNDYGAILRSVIEQLPEKYPELKIDNYVIMPNHIHMIIDICRKRAIRESPLQGRSLISKSLGYLKMNVSKKINIMNGRNIAIWQRSFYDHIIRSEQE